MTSLTLGYPEDVAQLSVVVERLPIGVIVFQKERKEIVYANSAARRLLQPVPLLAHGPLPDPWPAFSLPRYAEQLVSPGIAPDEHVAVDANRTYSISGITALKSTTGVILVEDISGDERRQRAEREFVANAAHELLTPLTGIVGAAHVLQAGAKNVPEDRDRFIAHIENECSRLARIARSLLVLARAQSGEEPPRLDIHLVAGLLDEVREQVEGAVTVTCEQDLTVLADADLFVQAGVNLVANSLQHGSGEGVVVNAKHVSKNLVEIDIADAGGREFESREFKARFRSTAGRDGGGFGLGLSIAQQSLEVMSGRLLLQPQGARIQLPGGAFSK